MSEGLPNFESREALIGRLIEELAQRKGMEVWEILSDIATFAEIAEGDLDAMPYFDIIKEETDISFDEVVEYAKKKAEEDEDAPE